MEPSEAKQFVYLTANDASIFLNFPSKTGGRQPGLPSAASAMGQETLRGGTLV